MLFTASFQVAGIWFDQVLHSIWSVFFITLLPSILCLVWLGPPVFYKCYTAFLLFLLCCFTVCFIAFFCCQLPGHFSQWINSEGLTHYTQAVIVFLDPSYTLWRVLGSMLALPVGIPKTKACLKMATENSAYRWGQNGESKRALACVSAGDQQGCLGA